MESVEAVVVGDGDVSAGLQQNRQHVVPLLADGVVERRVSLRVLQRAQASASLRRRKLVHRPVGSCSLSSAVYLKAGVAAEVQQRLHHLQVTLVDCDVKRRLPALVPGVEVGSSSVQDLDDGALVTEGGVMHGPVSVLILHKERGKKKKTIHSCILISVINKQSLRFVILVSLWLAASYITQNAVLHADEQGEKHFHKTFILRD